MAAANHTRGIGIERVNEWVSEWLSGWHHKTKCDGGYIIMTSHGAFVIAIKSCP